MDERRKVFFFITGRYISKPFGLVAPDVMTGVFGGSFLSIRVDI